MMASYEWNSTAVRNSSFDSFVEIRKSWIDDLVNNNVDLCLIKKSNVINKTVKFYKQKK